MLFDNNELFFTNFIESGILEKDEEGFLKGNMFKNEYVPYKKMTYIKPKLNSQQEMDLFMIMQYCFMINDYNLYLDLNPDNKEVFNAYKKANEKLKSLMDNYEKKYNDPLCISSSDFPKFEWVKSPWPWDREDGKYV